MHIKYNPNPHHSRVGDCVIRALCKVLHKEWEDVYINLCVYGLLESDMPSSNVVWGKYLTDHGFKRHIVPDQCPNCYTVSDFAKDHPNGTYMIALDGHVVAVCDGNIYDTWDSSNEVVLFYWQKE